MYYNIFVDYNDYTIHLWDDAIGYKKFKNPAMCYKKVDRETEIKSIYGDNVEKVNMFNLFDNDISFEKDVNIEMKILLDLYYKTDDISTFNKICFIDIETDSSGGYPDLKICDKKIISIACNNENKIDVFFLDENNRSSCTNTENITYHKYTDEKELFVYFLKYILDNKFTILSGWNVDNFDIPYIVGRGKNIIGEHIKMLSPINIIESYNVKGRDRYKIAGLNVLDLMELYKKYSNGERVSYSLNDISKLELDKNKLEYDGTLNDLYQNDINKFIEYNIQDVVLCKELELKLNYIKTCINSCHKGHIQYEDIYPQSKILEGAILTFLRRHNLVAPNKIKHEKKEDDTVLGKIDNWKELKNKIKVTKVDNNEYLVDVSQLENDFLIKLDTGIEYTKEEFVELIESEEIQVNTRGGVKSLSDEAEGAYVKDPLRGRYKWIIDLDYTSMYPSIIRSLNISPETKIGKVIDYQFDKEIYELKIQDKIFNLNKQAIKKLCVDNNFVIASNGTIYDTKKRGIIPSILDLWFEERVKFKKLSKEAYKSGNKELGDQYDIQQYILKILLNSMYGVLLNAGFRFYDPDNGEAVTITGQKLILYAEKRANEFLNNLLPDINKDYVVAIDTDSLLLSVEHHIKTKEDIYELANSLQKYVNDSLHSFVIDNFFIDYNKFVTINSDNTTEVKIDIVNSNIPVHYFDMKQEMIAESGLFIQKKRYIMNVIDKEKIPVQELLAKGIDIVRTNFPTYFKTKLKEVLQNILNGSDKQIIDELIFDIKQKMYEQNIKDIAIPTGVKKVMNFFDPEKRYKKGSPIHSKAAINHNLFLKVIDTQNMYEPIYNGEKIKYVKLKPNKYNFDVLAFKSNSPMEIINFCNEYIDYDAMLEGILTKKIQKIYAALLWDMPEFLIKPKKSKQKS